MGLDAFVPCNCLKEGKTTPPPVDKEWIILDEEGYIHLNSEYSVDSDLEAKVDEWSYECCPHQFMHMSEHICNWSGLRSFQQALIKLGIEHFPILGTQLPNVNGGSLGVESVEKALLELELFEQNIKTQSSLYLINAEDSQAIYEYIEVYGGRFLFSKPHSMGFNVNGLYIIDSEDNILFQSKRVTQKVYLYPNWICKFASIFNIKLKPVRKVVWIDLDTGKQFYTRWGLSFNDAYPKELAIESRSVISDDYQYIIQSLRKIFQISVDTGNSVYWC